MPQRSKSGFSLVEALVTTTIMSFVSIAMLQMLILAGKSNQKITSIEEIADAARIIKTRIGQDLREGRTLGDVYGQATQDPVNNDWVNGGSDWFPSPSGSGTISQDPLYGNGQTPPNGWPSSWTSPPWQLNNQTLIVQIPVTDNHADVNGVHYDCPASLSFPTSIQGPFPSAANPIVAAGQSVDNVETHVYMIVPDPSHPGTPGDPNDPAEFLLQYCSFPGNSTTATIPYASPGYAAGSTTFSYDAAAHNKGPLTLVSGIIGPLDASGNPKIFQFIDKTDPTGTPQDSITPVTSPTGQFVANYTGVVVNLEIRKHQMSNTKSVNYKLSPLAFKTEVFLRNNAEATPTGQPQTNW